MTMIPAGPSKWKLAFQKRQFDVQSVAGSVTPWVTDTDQFIDAKYSGTLPVYANSYGDVGSVGLAAEETYTGPTSGEGTVLTALATPSESGVDASASPGQLMSQQYSPNPGTTNYPYNTSIDAYVEGDLGYDEEPMS